MTPSQGQHPPFFRRVIQDDRQARQISQERTCFDLGYASPPLIGDKQIQQFQAQQTWSRGAAPTHHFQGGVRE